MVTDVVVTGGGLPTSTVVDESVLEYADDDDDGGAEYNEFLAALTAIGLVPKGEYDSFLDDPPRPPAMTSR
jgi:hypothetical protein